ncbi:endonuclease domain-containing protein [Kitasatospora sp. NPDC088783]|uniref:endonuclease domain-containing protein n=1 Tax=Kitasatospora sp. NPDC088783 TaxID=3364077 RepID=UPI003806B8B0
MLIPLAVAQATATTVLTAPVLRFAPGGLHSNFLRDTGNMYLGAAALPGVKRSGVWHVDSVQLERALAEFAAVAAAPGRLVSLGLPWTGLSRGYSSADGWRQAVQAELIDRAARSRRRPAAAALLDAGLAPAVQRQAGKELDRLLYGGGREPEERKPLVVAGVAVMDVVRRRAGAWSIPSAWADLLDRWHAEHLALLARARRCAGCGTAADRFQEVKWRSSGADGWITQCPACAGGEYRLYGGAMQGVLYNSERRRATRADDYLCAACGQRRATVWDHCHTPSHGLVRGPACANCNQAERSQYGIWRDFWNHGSAVRHLLRCDGCRASATLPPWHLSSLVAARLRAAVRHGRCSAEPQVALEPLAGGGFLARLACTAHPGREVGWEEAVTAESVAGWVAGLMAEHS